MSNLAHIIKNDFRLVFRDPTLRVFLFLPILIFGVILGLFPYLLERYEGLRAYGGHILAASSIQMLQMFGFVYSMTLIDAKASGVSKVYGVSPIEKRKQLFTQLIFPLIITFFLTLILFATQRLTEISITRSILLSAQIGLILPIYILSVVVLSKNRVEGLLWVKTVNLLLILPLITLFLPGPLKYLGVLLPTFSIFDTCIEGTLNLLVFTIYLLVVLVLYFMLWKKYLKTQFL